MKSRIFRAVVCLILVCCLCVNMIPRRTEAFVLTGTTAAGVAAYLFSLAMGVVVVDLTVDLLNGMGQSLKDSAASYYADDSSTLESFITWLDGLTFDPLAEITTISPDEAFRPVIAHWGAKLMTGEGVEVENSNFDGLFSTSFSFSTGAPGYSSLAQSVSLSANTAFLPMGFVCTFGETGYYLGVFGCCDSSTTVSLSGDTSTSRKLSYNSTYGCYINRLFYASGDPQYYFDSASFPVVDLGHYADLGSCELAGYSYLSSYYLSKGQTVVYPSTYVGDLPSQVQNGEKDEDDIPIPEIDFSKIFEGQTDAVEALNNVSTQLANGTLTHEDYLEMTTVGTSSDVGTGEGTGSDVGDVTGTLGGTEAATFFDKLVAIITAPFEWIWSKIEVLFGPWIESIGTWFSEIGAKIEAIPAAFAGWFENIISGIEAIPGAFAGWFSDVIEGVLSIPAAIGGVFEDVIAGVIALPTTITNSVVSALETFFVPDSDYITEKVDALCENYTFADSIVKSAQALNTGLAGVTTEPPVIYIDLGATRGSYNIGGTVPFLDLRWYAEYKSTVDTMISAFLWICFVWRMLLKLPGIISGMPGDFMMASAHTMGLNDLLPSRSAEYEQMRIERRESIRKGRK